MFGDAKQVSKVVRNISDEVCRLNIHSIIINHRWEKEICLSMCY